MQLDMVRSYLASGTKTPFFLFTGDEEYPSVVVELKGLGLDIVQLSGFCKQADKLPDIDGLLSCMEGADICARTKRFVVTGLGETLALLGADEAGRVLGRLKDFNIGGAKIILLLRGIAPLIADLETDVRFDKRRYAVLGSVCELSFTLINPSIGLTVLNGFQNILKALEDGETGNIAINTSINLCNAMLSVHQISDAYEGIVYISKGFPLARSFGTDAQWSELLLELSGSGASLFSVFDKYGLGGNLETDFYSYIAGNDFRSWLCFICLKCKAATLQNGYLSFVLDKADSFETFVGLALNAIIDIPYTHKRFATFYRERKSLVKRYPEAYIIDFIRNNRKIVEQSIFKLTDNTLAERKEIVAWVSVNGLVPELEGIYPALASYLRTYVFKCEGLAGLLTNYFKAYKKQKLANKLESAFLETVDELALSREFNQLPSRDEILEGVDKDGTYLYWLDAMGVEYLSLIEDLAQKRGLSLKINIVRSELPTITTINRRFFDEWPGEKNGKNGDKTLDEIKHKPSGGYDYTENKLPIHLANELDIIISVMDNAAAKLKHGHCKRFVIASDHGASRLAVLRCKEELYETDTSAKHSGRCCMLFSPYELPFATEENGYLVLADYGRFKGSRKADVEVHGGASLEEVVVPIIELTLKEGSVNVELVDENVTVDYKYGTEIMLFVNSFVQDVSVIIDEKRYTVDMTDPNHFKVKLPDIKRAGEYSATVYTGDEPIGTVLIKARGKSVKVNDDFDDLFGR